MEPAGWMNCQAAILRAKIRQLDAWNGARRANTDSYDPLSPFRFRGSPPRALEFRRAIFHQYTVRVQQRARAQSELAKARIASTVHYPVPIHLQPIYASLNYRPGDLPETEKASAEVLSLPMYPELNTEQIQLIAQAIGSALRG
jgi:dTDP-4-amino-4,6-dideoxygalactose transaminase